MSNKEHNEYQYDRPIIIVAAPRSGSTLLFETLCRAKNLWTIGGESHTVFEHIRQLDPSHGICTSNRLTEKDANGAIANHIRKTFYENLRDRNGRLRSDFPNLQSGQPRFLEKTPKNALRLPFLNKIFPDARYIYLFRDPRENMSSMIEAWRSSDFVTYRNLPDWPGKWSFLLPPNYGQLRGTSLEEIVAFQWIAANEFILADLDQMPAERWTAVGYSELLADAPATIERLCRFADIQYDEELQTYCQNALPQSRYTQSSPDRNKWRKNEDLIERVMPDLKPLIGRIEMFVAPHSNVKVLQSGAVTDIGDSQALSDTSHPIHSSRNAKCHCGSGLRYKHCHGTIQSTLTGNVGTKV